MDGQKCAHGRCTCFVDLGQEYCGSRCREMARTDPDAGPHGHCGCHHEACQAG
jgi:hypothetical protein